jgi:uncharacterized protein
MTRMIFVSLPVTDLKRSLAFYEAVGAMPDPRFSDDSAAAVSFSDAIHVMLLTHERTATFTSRRIVDAHKEVQVGLGLSSESREAVDATIARAVAAGGRADPDPMQDHGFMYGRSFADPDGHIWDMNWMDVDAAMAAGQTASESQPV